MPWVLKAGEENNQP